MEIPLCTGVHLGGPRDQRRTYLGILKCGDEESPGVIPALVDQVTWNKVQAMRRKAKRQRRPPEVKAWRVKSPFLLSGIIYCGHCGPAMRGGRDMRNTRWGGEVWLFYVCGCKDRQGWRSCKSTGKFDARRVEAAVMRAGMEQVLTPRTAAEIADPSPFRACAYRLFDKIGFMCIIYLQNAYR